MRIVIDLQGAQSESRFRGIGRYTLSLAQAIVRNRGEHEIIIALNGLLQNSIESICAAFDHILPRENIRIWQAVGPVRECTSDNSWRREAAERIREAFIASLKPDVVHVSSLFEGYLDDAVTSIALLDQSTPTVVTLYDLIPLLNRDHYLQPNSIHENYYLTKISHLRKASGWLSISMHSALEGQKALGLSEQLTFNISSGCDSKFVKLEVSKSEEKQLRDRFGLTKPFVVSAGGSDSRKNLARLIKSYAQLEVKIRQQHQLLLVGKMPDGDINTLKSIAQTAGLHEGELTFAGYVNDEDLVLLLNLCKVFVFPSWHEGFGLPALEAMACGAPVIGANTSSLPEVIGRTDALFDPFSEESITKKITEVLEDKTLREDLSKYGLSRSQLFSWDDVGRRAIHAFEQIKKQKQCEKYKVHPLKKPKLAYVSPLPPERTGIAYYSVELLPALSRYYDIEIIVAQDQTTDFWVSENCPIRTPEWFEKHVDDYSRVLYHFGNSPFHQYMFGLLEKIPGVVCLHDFFMSGYSRYMETTGKAEFYWCLDLYQAHGYKAVRKRFHERDSEAVMYEYPCNFNILQFAHGIIVHSDYSRRLAAQWYSPSFSQDWVKIPLVREPCTTIADWKNNRSSLGFKKDDFIVCSFGFLSSTKLNHRLLAAWFASDLAKDSHCYLIFVGENHGGDYGQSIVKTILKSGAGERVRITGWTDNDEYRRYLDAADMAVQFRAFSRGETSAAVLDCMNHALPTIVNANGSLADLPDDTVWMLDDEFEEADLVKALETIWRSESKRHALGRHAQEMIFSKHAPDVCARQYSEAIEMFFHEAKIDRRHLVRSIAAQDTFPYDERAWLDLATCIARNQPNRCPARNLFIDITATSRIDLKTGIERVARALLLELINNPPSGYRVEPVYLTDQGGRWHYRYARHYTLKLLECPFNWLDDEPIDARPGDILFGVDLAGSIVVEAEKDGIYQILKKMGLYIYFMVFDLLPIKIPEFFPPGASEDFNSWLKSICHISDHIICISNSVADEMRNWVEDERLSLRRPLKIDWIHLGANFDASRPTKGVSSESRVVFAALKARPTFLMVGTIEPRKGYMQAIAAFDLLWKNGTDVNLVIVGKEGWKALPDKMRRTIPKIMDTLLHHSELEKRLFWLEGISDEYLGKVYRLSDCLVAASENEGFGLPLIEAAQYNLPIIARNIAVFHEVLGKYAYYFDGLSPGDLASAIENWLVLFEQKKHPRSEGLPWITWEQSTESLKKIILKEILLK